VGGYTDWLRQRKTAVADSLARAPAATSAARAVTMSPSGAADPSAAALKARRLSYNERRELAQLPEKIQSLEAEQVRLTTLINDPQVFQRNKDQGSQALQRLQVVAEELDSAYARWETLDKASGAGSG
jgi:ABC transport system ATP-binding/permease protein